MTGSHPGRLIAVVGPSGVGKDTVMAALATQRPDLHVVRRVITRPASAGGEEFDSVTTDRFGAMQASGAFALHWQAHGLHYGIPASVDATLTDGQDAIVNLSRTVLDQANTRFAGFCVLRLSATGDTLAARLTARDRETSDDIADRLRRAPPTLPTGLAVIDITNDGPLGDTVQTILAALFAPAVNPCPPTDTRPRK